MDDNKESVPLLHSSLIKKANVLIIPEHIKKGIRQGMEDIKNGDFITLEEFEKKYEKWLK